MAGVMQSSGGRKAPIVGINITPMVDVMLVLLVIMMVSAVYIVSQSLKVELPKTSTSDQPASSPLSVTVTKDGKYYFDQKPIDEAGLMVELRNAKRKNADVSLVVLADREAYYGEAVHVIDLAKVSGITKFALNVERTR